MKKVRMKSIDRIYSSLIEDELSRALRITSKAIGRDWNRLYWQLPFHPVRGQEELSQDIKQIDAKYKRGHVSQVSIYGRKNGIRIKIYLGSSC